MAGWLLALLCALVLLVIVVVCVLMHAGYFSDLRIRTTIPASLPKRVAYTLHRGPYTKVGEPLSHLNGRAPKLIRFCIFYDDPKEVTKEDLRCIVGCSLPDSADSPLEKSLKASGYSLWTFPNCKKAVVTEFPDRSFVSCIIAPGIVYPALNRYFKQFDLKWVGPVVEVYMDGYIQYIAPIENNEGFFVPEVAQQQESKKVQ